MKREIIPPFANPDIIPPELREKSVPAHVAIIMDGNGRWANSRGLPRTEGHKVGELALLDTVAGAIEAGVKYLSVYAFSTENWRRSPAEVRFLMGYSRDVLRARCDQLNEWNVRVRWSGRRPRLWKSVIAELERAQELTSQNTGLTLVMNLNYGGRAEITDAAQRLAMDVAQGNLNPERIRESTFGRYLYLPDVPDVDLLIRTSGEQRLSNYLLWQCAYAEMYFATLAWPDFGRFPLWEILTEYSGRQRRFGGAREEIEKS
ncbi:isoprenyl transferase [Actinomycetaceae bacterium TAE3-ERU4]|nr:isoprenyl transferase [Actinomycetaceae bacterium TAE3-ERU4]